MVFSSAAAQTHSASVHYRLTSVAEGVMLELWEPKTTTHPLTSDYQFCLRYKFDSESAAREVLLQYLKTNAIERAIAHAADDAAAITLDPVMYSTLG